MQMRCTLVRTAVFLPGTSVIRKLSVPVHGKPGFANGCTAGNLVWILRVSLVEWDHTVTVVNIMNGVVDRFHIISLVCNKGAFLYRQVSTGFLQDVQSDGGICHIGSGSYFTDRKPGDAIHQDMVFIAPIELKIAFIVLVGSGMDTESTV